MNRQTHDVQAASNTVEWQAACTLEEVPEGTPKLVRIGTRHAVVIRRGDDVHAFEPLCPHKFAPLEDGHLDGDCLVCPVHEAHFDLATGAPREGDGWAGQLRAYPAHVDGDTIMVAFTPTDQP